MAQIAALLDEWNFQPAMKDNEPIEVEILLAIPPRS
jgi:hypothetical protein